MEQPPFEIPEGYTYVTPKVIGKVVRTYIQIPDDSGGYNKSTMLEYTLGFYDSQGNIIQAGQGCSGVVGLEM